MEDVEGRVILLLERWWRWPVVLFLAAVAGGKAVAAVGEVGYKSVLLSFAGGAAGWRRNWGLLLDPSARLMVDSGAYTAWTQGKEIDLESYAGFCRGLLSCAACRVDFVNLDFIPGRSGETPTGRQREESARRGWENLEKIRSLGVPAMPVFHQFESFHWLERMLDSYDYIGISPSNDEGPNSKFNWLQDVFALLVGRTKLVRTHAFGVAAHRLLLGFPFYSADSTTWQNPAKYGELLKVALPGRKGIKWLAHVKTPVRGPIRTKQDHRRLVESLGDTFLSGRSASLDFAHVLVMQESDTFQCYKLGVEVFGQYQRFLTAVWEGKGFDWGE